MKYFILLIILSVLNIKIHSQEKETPYTIEEIQLKLHQDKYNESVLMSFQKEMENLYRRPELREEIPGEIISWASLAGRFSIKYTYKVEKDSVRKISVRPKDKKFLEKLNSYVPEKSRFTYSSDLWSFPYVKDKSVDEYYIIRATVKSYNSRPMIPNDDILVYTIEYRTKDFENFELLRLKENTSKDWIEVVY